MGCSSIVDPRSAPTTTYDPAATDSIYTTTPNVVLRPGDPLTVSVNVESLPNAPLDLYILMDLSDSMAAPLATVKSISQLIAQQVSSFTTNVRIGFGAFNDKPIYPYSPQTPAGCLPGRDALDCSDSRAISYLQVPNVFVTTNLDLPESSFDALVQVLACEQELGWRNRSVEGPERGLQRVVLLITDNQPHLVGDGRDYPSVGLVASLLKKYDVIPIFGIVPITSSTLLINNTFLSSYQEVIQNIAITLPTRSDVEVSLTQITCPKLSYLACSTPTNLVLDAFKLFNNDFHHCFMDCTGFETSDKAWCQAQLGLNRGGLGLSLHSSSMFIASFCSSGVYDSDGIHLTNALDHFNAHVPQSTNCPSFLQSPHLSNWDLGSPVALDIVVVSPLNPSTLTEARAMVGAVLRYLQIFIICALSPSTILPPSPLTPPPTYSALTFSVPGFGATTISVDKVCSCSCDKAGDSVPVAAVRVMQRHTAGSGRAKPVNVLLPITVTALTQHLSPDFLQLRVYVLTPGFSGAIKLASSWRAGTRQYSFLHPVNYTSNFTVPNVFVTTNLDLPESSFDALVQVLACEQELGWRNRSVEGPERGLQRLVLLITDNQPHLAGDGRDNPSVGLVASLLKKYDVIPIFGIVPITSSTLLINNTFLSSYQALQDLMTSVGTKAFAQPISSSASDVLDVIKTVYQDVIQNIAITLPTRRDVAVSLTQIACPNSDEAWCQAQLGLNRGGLGLRSLSLHSSSTFIASFCSSDYDDTHLTNALDHFNAHFSPINKLSIISVVLLTCQSEALIFKSG
ncbi:hypothetical protein EMCRGX_G012551 [Ephydatia muelleri]